MKNPWDIKVQDKREADTLATFIIFCEDEVSEPIYFKYFETNQIKVNPIKNQKSMMENVKKALLHCQENDLTESTEDGSLKLLEGKTHVWCVYDRDKEETEKKVNQGNLEFDESISWAKRKGFNIAWSNDSFELWILLHFEDVSTEKDQTKHRSYYYDRLTEIFKNLDNPNEDLIKVLKYGGYSYKTNLKSANNFRNIVRAEIINKTQTAINRAKLLEKYFDSGPPNENAPCTLVHHLVEELLKTGGKEL